MDPTFEEFIRDYPNHLDSPEWLSKSIVHLSSLLYTHNTKMALAELDESNAMVRYLSQENNGKRMAVSEAEVRAKSDTQNRYHEMTAQQEAIIEVIQSIKKRLEVLTWERYSQQY